ncbi:ATP-dependent helicase [Candidatus Azobacteroides pseudotrichonymphae]|uniref:DNA 3'-5' helicase n=1 Tax=Azobacteroides pseudotrichonymphae genomovar. CFP2 TaxID=511995 RepID=B6YRQ2_AZOPC|nr:UvrD-helicase domain-containing protein [Candidatus Azobacteroides pseudotrichonymphae]BAG83874.1 ATP-dependent DNA helicase II [Candidatus Azobacteroides pseudotrichonymphae genomovar. CFP2]
MADFLQQLNESQREAVIYNDGPSLVIAGAGSGKTRVITYKIAYLLKNGISPHSILALTFTNKAAREMKVRVTEIIGENMTRLLWIGTFHSIFSKILRREASRIGFYSDFTIYDKQDSKNLIKNIIKEKKLDDKIYKPTFVQNIISKAKNALITPKQYANNCDLIEQYNQAQKAYILYDIYLTYSNRCKIANAMDFDDLLFYTYLLFNECKEIAQKYWNRFQFILVDEYQDTNFAQHEIIQQLTIEQHHRICIVGDDAQSIYSFRGANISNILNFRSIYPESKLFKLEQNYRSTQTIVNAANSLISKNREQIPKTIYSQKAIGEKIRLTGFYSDYEEGSRVANCIAEMHMLKKYEYKDFVILYRTNAQSRIFEEALRKLNIPYKIYGGLSFYQRKEIKDVVAYMRLASNLADEEAIRRIINYPNRGIGDITVNKIIAAASFHNTILWEVLSNPLSYNLKINAATFEKLKKFQLLINRFVEKVSTQNAYNAGRMIIRETGLINNELYEDQTPENISRIQNLEELSNSLYTFVSSRIEEGNANIKISDFLAEIFLLTDQDTDKNENINFVTMMTIHSAKGLEFKNVFVVGLEEGLFPSELSKQNLQEIEEERRLFYVAITRAKENVILTYAKNRFQNGQFHDRLPSRFIKDIDEQYLSLPSKSHVCTNSGGGGSFKESSLINHQNNQSNIGDLRIGNKIRHKRFGDGRIVALIGKNDNAQATVEFEQVGIKQLLLKFARIEMINDD